MTPVIAKLFLLSMLFLNAGSFSAGWQAAEGGAAAKRQLGGADCALPSPPAWLTTVPCTQQLGDGSARSHQARP